jgi:hypothetical protein
VARLNDDAKRTIAEYSDWIIVHRQQIPNRFPIDTSREAFAATYPLHPSVLSVFERKWQTATPLPANPWGLRCWRCGLPAPTRRAFQGAHKDHVDWPGHRATGRPDVPVSGLRSSSAKTSWKAR